MKRDDLQQLIGAAKILDILWDNSYYSMGKLAADRIEKEMVCYFGKNWATTMYKLIDKDPKALRKLRDVLKNEKM